MTDTDYDDDDNGTDETDARNVTLNRAAIRKMEKRAKDADAAEQRAVEAERRAAFAEAGIKLSDPKMSYFVKGYDGEMTADAITAAATEAGFLAAPTDDSSSSDLEALDRVSNASGGSNSKPSGNEKVAGLYAAADQGRDALIARIRADGHEVKTA